MSQATAILRSVRRLPFWSDGGDLAVGDGSQLKLADTPGKVTAQVTVAVLTAAAEYPEANFEMTGWDGWPHLYGDHLTAAQGNAVTRAFSAKALARQATPNFVPAYDLRTYDCAGDQYNVHGTFGSSRVSTSKVSSPANNDSGADRRTVGASTYTSPDDHRGRPRTPCT